MVSKLVLDTNIVLDWLVFADESAEALRDDIAQGRIVALTHDLALEELRRVLGYKQLRLDASRQRDVFESYKAATTRATVPEGFAAENLLLPPSFPLCRDPDDQHFLALAFHAKADALVSKDKAVLKVRRHARRFGVEIVTLRELPALAS